ncbi:MAG TPA: AMP-binding protein [Fulvivirga sp.]|nr:AMP-binding protein [Fulvivirga sp.]
MAWLLFDTVKHPIDQLTADIAANPFQNEVLTLINQWQNGQKTFSLTTSGSTGKPQEIEITREQMMISANNTIKALNLLPDQTVLLCINPAFIGGKMMLIRALINNMNIVALAPTSNPLLNVGIQLDFIAVVPLQLTNIINNEQTRQHLKRVGAVIVGGGEISSTLEKDLQPISTPIFATYGMTETVSHIALRRVNGEAKSNYFNAFANVILSVDQRDCLTICAPVTNNQTIITNDRVKLIDSHRFQWLGRVDNVINTGGIKVQAEEVEQKIEPFISKISPSRFFIYGIPDELLGQRVTLFVEGEENEKLSSFIDQCKGVLTRYEIPKELVFLKKFMETDNGKIQRKKTVESR